METRENKLRIIKSSQKAIDELIKVIEEEIIVDINFDDEDVQKALEKSALSADKLKSAAQTKKLAIFDALDILDRIALEEKKIKAEDELEKSPAPKKEEKGGGFAETFAKKR